MKEFIFRSTDLQIRETKEGQEFVALEWRVANNKELMSELRACGVEKYEKRDSEGEKIDETE